MTRSRVVIVDYGMGNLFSIERVVNYLGGDSIVSHKPSVIVAAEQLILPGVGAFGDGMENLRERGLIEPIEKFARSGRPLLGICLGMQLLVTESDEFGHHLGLNLMPGKVKRLSDSNCKIPHIGWNKLHSPKGNDFWKGTILQNIYEGAFVYFVHSYAVTLDSPLTILAETIYGTSRFCSTLQQGNLFGCQFHPEVSGEIGLQIIRNFLFGSKN